MFNKSYTIMALALASLPVGAINIVTNGSFENIGTATASFSINNPTVLPGWTATPSGNMILDCLVRAGATANLCGTAFGGGFTFWVNPGPSPDGGNYVAIDGDPAYETALTQTLTGLTSGAQYTVSFWQAAAQQNGFTGATTERWQVGFGSSTQLTSIMNNASHGAVGWNRQTLTFTASGASQLLSFLAVGTPNGQPPFVLLDGVSVNQIIGTPEPATFGMLGAALLGLPLIRRMRKKKS